MINTGNTTGEFTVTEIIQEKKSKQDSISFHQEMHFIGKYTNLIGGNVIVTGKRQGTKATTDVFLCEC
jgi:hypothetical protein